MGLELIGSSTEESEVTLPSESESELWTGVGPRLPPSTMGKYPCPAGAEVPVTWASSEEPASSGRAGDGAGDPD